MGKPSTSMDFGKYEDDDAAWTPQEDPESGFVYYYNNTTGESSWSEPPSTTTTTTIHDNPFNIDSTLFDSRSREYWLLTLFQACCRGWLAHRALKYRFLDRKIDDAERNATRFEKRGKRVRAIEQWEYARHVLKPHRSGKKEIFEADYLPILFYYFLNTTFDTF